MVHRAGTAVMYSSYRIRVSGAVLTVRADTTGNSAALILLFCSLLVSGVRYLSTPLNARVAGGRARA